MFANQQLIKKWGPVLDHPDLPKINGIHRKGVTAQLLENQELASQKGSRNLFEAPTNPAPVGTGGASGNIAYQDPVLISMIRRTMPNLMAFDVAGVQSMTGPTGTVFVMRSKYVNSDGTIGSEALYNEPAQISNRSVDRSAAARIAAAADYVAQHGGTTGLAYEQLGYAADNTTTPGTNGDTAYAADQSAVNIAVADPTPVGGGLLLDTVNPLTVPAALSTAQGESLGDAVNNSFNEMAFTIDRVTVTAQERALKGDYSMELAQDLQAVHGLSAEAELSNILSQEILSEMNRELVRSIYATATPGATGNVAAGVFNMANSTDNAGARWGVEKYKQMIFQIEKEANVIGQETRRGKGNIVICSADVASAMNAAGLLDIGQALPSNLETDGNVSTFAGYMAGGRIKVFVDPFAAINDNFFVVGYKGTTSVADCGMIFAPYRGLELITTIDSNTFQPKMAYKTRYGLVANPFATAAGDGVVTQANKNIYYRKVQVSGL